MVVRCLSGTSVSLTGRGLSGTSVCMIDRGLSGTSVRMTGRGLSGTSVRMIDRGLSMKNPLSRGPFSPRTMERARSAADCSACTFDFDRSPEIR